MLEVRLTPKSSRDQVDGVGDGPDGPVLKARVRAVPDQGAANAALERLITDWLGVTQRSVSLKAGGKSRLKSIAIAGDPAELIARIRELVLTFPQS